MRLAAVGQVSIVVGLSVLLSCTGCKSKAPPPPPPGAVASAGLTASARSASVASAAPTPAVTSSAQLPEGPVLAIQAGQGVGPIRLGATVATIERLMAAPCEVKTAEVCRYIVRAVEFHLGSDGFTDRIVVHRHDRPAGLDAHGKPQAYGFFNGGIPPGAGLGMVPKAVLEIIGKPVKSERVNEPNPNHTIDRDTYPGGMVLEYDEYLNGKVMPRRRDHQQRKEMSGRATTLSQRFACSRRRAARALRERS